MRICNLANSVPFKKNPFHGRELICFANPNNPGGPGESGEKAEGKVFEDFKNVVPGRMEYNPTERWETQQHWVALVGDYDGVQNNINRLVASRKELLDDRIFNKANFRQQFEALVRPKYQELQKIAGTVTLNEAEVVNRIRENAMNQLTATRGQAVEDTDRVIRALLVERKEKLRLMNEMMRENTVDRVRHLRDQWEHHAPAGYEDVREEWMEYCDELVTTLEAQDLSNLDTGDVNFPQGSELYKDYKIWWDMVSQIEDSYKDFRNVDNNGLLAELSDEKMTQHFEGLKKRVTAALEGDVLKKFNEAADKLASKASKMQAILEDKIAQSENAEDKKFFEDQLKVLNDKVKELEAKRDLKGMVEKAFYSKKEIAKFPPDSEDGIPVPEGLEGQLKFLKTAPLGTAARRALARSMFEGMKEVERNILSYKDFAEIQAVESLESMRLFEEGVNNTGSGEPTREIMMVNPFETMGHFWHSLTTTIKGNVETDAKRGAGYFQRDVTKILTHIPAPLTKLNVIKSLTELHPNGAQEAEHAEHGRVADIEKGYDAFNTEHLQHLASIAIDRWEFKACLNILAKRGRIDFYAPWLFKQLNQWQRTIKMPTDRYWHQKNLTASDEMLRQAFVYIYRDSEGFKTLKNTNASSYESKMGEFSKNWGSIAAEPGALEREAEKILNLYESDHHAGVHFSKADPIKFESIIRYAVDQGKMKGEARLRLLTRGIASGLLPFDRGVNATDKNNTYPPFDWYDAPTVRGGRPTIDDIKEMAAYAKDASTWDFYMHKHVMYNELVNQRLDKTLSQGSHRVDHDDAPMLAGYLKVSTVRDLLTQKTAGGYGMPMTGLLSLSTGNEFWLDMYAELYKDRSAETNKLEMIRFSTQFLMYEGILNRRVYKDQTNMFRLEPDTAAKAPRTGGSYSKVFGRDGDAGTGQIVKGVAGHIAMLDFDDSLPLIKNLIEGKIKSNAEAAAIAARLDHEYGIFQGSPPTTIDKLYDAMPAYIQYSIEQNPARLNAMVASLRREHAEAEAAAKKKAKDDGKSQEEIDQIKLGIHVLERGDHEADEVRKDALRRAQGLPEPAHHGHGAHGDHGGHGGHAHGGHDGHGEHGHGEEGHDDHHEGEHPAEGHDAGAAHGSTPAGGGPTSGGSTHGGGH